MSASGGPDILSRLRGWVRALASGAQLGRFMTVGAIGAVCDVAVLIVLVEFLGVLPEIGALAGIEVSIVVMFLLNEFWTFRRTRRPGLVQFLRRLGRSHAVRASAVIVQFLLFVLIYRVFFIPVTAGGLDLWLVVAKGGGIGLGFTFNYILETLFTWRVQTT